MLWLNGRAGLFGVLSKVSAKHRPCYDGKRCADRPLTSLPALRYLQVFVLHFFQRIYNSVAFNNRSYLIFLSIVA